MSGHHTRMRFCGIDVSARPDNQQLCTLHERKGSEGVELVATFYAPGTVEDVARTIQGFGRGESVVGIDAPSGRRLGLLGPRRARPRDARPARRALRAHAGVRRRPLSAAACRCTRSRPRTSRCRSGWRSASASSTRSRRSARYVPERADGVLVGRRRQRRDPVRAGVRDLSGRDLLRAARPPPAAQAHAVGRPAADRGAQAQGHLRRRRRAVAPHARRDRRLRRRLRRLRAERRPRHLGRRPGRGGHGDPDRPPARALPQAAARRRAPGWRSPGPTIEGDGTSSRRPRQANSLRRPAHARAGASACLLHRRLAGGRRHVRAQGAAAHRRRRRRRRARPAPREAASQPLPRLRQGRRAQAAAQGGGRQPRRRRRRADPAPGAQPRGGARDAGDRPHRGDPRHLRRPRPHRRRQAPGRARAARVQHGPHAGAVDAPRASRRGPRRRRHRHARPRRVPDRDRPPARARPHLRAAAAARPGEVRRARSCAPSASARTCPTSRWPATPTPASRRCSTPSRAPTSASATASSTRSTRPRARCACTAAPTW